MTQPAHTPSIDSPTPGSPAAAASASGRKSEHARPRWTTLDTSLVAVMAALVAVFAMFPPIPVGTVGVPITLQTLAVVLCGMLLGPVRGFASVSLYVVLGLVGLPIFSGFRGGLGILAGPSAGYILAFPISALLIGFVAVWVVRRFTGGKAVGLLFAGSVVAGMLSTHLLGILGMMLNAELTFSQALLADMVFWPGDILKTLVAAVIAVFVHRAFPSLLVRRK